MWNEWLVNAIPIAVPALAVLLLALAYVIFATVA